jgi:nucleoid DNA-binding protein
MSASDDPNEARSHRTATSQQMLEAVLAKRLNLDNDTVSAVVNELQNLVMQIAREGGRVKLDHMGVFEKARNSTSRVSFIYRPKL